MCFPYKTCCRHFVNQGCRSFGTRWIRHCCAHHSQQKVADGQHVQAGDSLVADLDAIRSADR